MKFPDDPRLPIMGGVDYERSMYQRLYDLFRHVAQQLNGLAEGNIVASYNAASAAPTAGEHYQGDFIRNREPVDLGGYIVMGWVCVASGAPGTWKECRCQTV